MYRLVSLLGLFALLLIAWAFSTDRKKINLRTVGMGVGLQFLLGIFLLKIELTSRAFSWVTDRVINFLNLSEVGSRFVFGVLADKDTLSQLFDKTLGMPHLGGIFIIKVVSTIIFFAAFISILYHLGIMQFLVEAIAKVMQRTMKTSGAETLSCSANIFVGMTEAPLIIKPYLDTMTMSELHAVMVGGFATIAGGVLAAYIGMGISAKHLIIASVMSAPAALAVAKILLPETEHTKTAGDIKAPRIKVAENVIDAAVKGTTDGLRLALNVAAILIAFLALLAFVDVILGFADRMIDHKLLGRELLNARGEYIGIFPGSLGTFFGTLLAPLAWVMGVPWVDAKAVGNLLGLKISANEFVAYSRLSSHMAGVEGFQALSERAQIIATYALCGFANFGSIGITIGGISAVAPDRRADLSKLGLRAMFGGALASWMTATVAGILIS